MDSSKAFDSSVLSFSLILGGFGVIDSSNKGFHKVIGVHCYGKGYLRFCKLKVSDPITIMLMFSTMTN